MDIAETSFMDQFLLDRDNMQKLYTWMEENKHTLHRLEDVMRRDWDQHGSRDVETLLFNPGLWTRDNQMANCVGYRFGIFDLRADARVPSGFIILLGEADRFLALLPLD